MKKILLVIVCCVLCISFSAKAKEYDLSKTKMCGKKQLCDMDGKLLNGVAYYYWMNGQLHSESLYKEGKLDGISKRYYENGYLESEGFYQDGKIEGIYKEYHENGNLMKEVPYKEGNVNGTVKEYYKDGNLKREMLVENDKIRGIVKEYYKNHKLKEKGKYKDETEMAWIPMMEKEKEGLWETYDVNGILGCEEYYKDGRLEWRKNYDKNGNLETKYVYQGGEIGEERQTIEYYSKNGNLWFEENYKGTFPIIKDGLRIVYDEEGNKTEEIMFENDKPLYGFLYDKAGRKREMTKAHLHNKTKKTKQYDNDIENAVHEYMQRFPNEHFEKWMNR